MSDDATLSPESEKTLKQESIHSKVADAAVAYGKLLHLHGQAAICLQALGTALDGLAGLEGVVVSKEDAKRALDRLVAANGVDPRPKKKVVVPG